jgi:hypothetical protein|tara:strand:- start:57 stop:479 length:423 start_codon:yes stop_codon:yes gene_type:complete
MDWSYISGFFDADGNLHLVHNKRKGTYQLQIRFFSSNKEALSKIREFLDGKGNIYLKKQTKGVVNRSEVYECTFTKKQDCLWILKNIFPHSIIRRQQIQFLLENYNFNRIKNGYFDIDKFRSFVTRKNVKRIHHTIYPLS